MKLVLLPWEDRRNHHPLYNTKLPPAPMQPTEYGLDIAQLKDIPHGSVVIVGGAGILPERFVTDNTVVNCHCGWLPTVRGLDSLKWAIYHGHKIGCTTHVIDGECDAGKLIERDAVEVESTDSLFAIAMKQYELELKMMVDCVLNKRWGFAQPFSEPRHNPTRRMDHRTELQMMARLQTKLRVL